MINKNFSPHIEMLQRHMLSQQFPGLINPLLSGFPGFPGGPPPLAFANPLQQLLAGSGNAAAGGGPAGLPAGSSSPGNGNLNANGNNGQRGGPASLSSDLKAAVEAGQLLHGHGGFEGQRQVTSSSTGSAAAAGGGGSKKRRFKCSKCQVKFKKREDCLRHIHAQHSTSTSSRRKLQFTSPQHSSAKAVRNNRVRSHYVKRLMEILRVPTSRGTPSSASNDHIMQAFLIKSQQEMEADTASDENDCFVPSMVYLPVARKINQPMTVAFSLTPA